MRFRKKEKRRRSGVEGNEAEMNGHGYEWKLISGSIIQKIDIKNSKQLLCAWSLRKRERERERER